MKKSIAALVILFTSMTVYSQQFEIVQTFPYGELFEYTETWDAAVQGSPGFISITSIEDVIVLGNLRPCSWVMFRTHGANWELINTVNTPQFGAFHTTPVHNGLITYQYLTGGGIFIYDINGLHDPQYFLEYNSSEHRFSSVPPYLTGKYLFCESSSRDLSSFELLSNGEYTFRNIEETQELLDEGLGEELGYRKDSYSEYNYFGDFCMSSPWDYGYSPISMNLDFDNSQFPDLTSLRDFSTIGYDSKGINYFYSYLPEPFKVRSDKMILDNFQVVIAVVDTWTRRVIFRILPIGDWTPPIRIRDNGRYQTIGTFPKTVHPNGDIYFVDADTELQEYQIKRLTNDWWAELGIDEREILRIDGNHIPLRLEPGSAQNNGFNYENEFVWVQEHQGEWLRVRKIDGREGWILESETYDEGY